jgi:hypothetical protein
MVDVTNLSAINSLSDLATYTNNETSSLLFTGGIVTLFIVMVLMLVRNEWEFVNALSVSGWIFFIVSGFLWLSHLIPAVMPLLFLFISGFATFYIYASR